jgi:hypothetical protein
VADAGTVAPAAAARNVGPNLIDVDYAEIR